MTTLQSSAVISPHTSPISPQQIASLLASSDLFGLLLSFTAAFWLRFSENINFSDPTFYCLAIVLLLGLYLANAYRPYENIAGLWSPSRVVIANIVSSIIISSLLYLFSNWNLTPLVWRSVLFPGIALFTIWAVISRKLLVTKLKAHARKSSWLVIGQCDLLETFRKDFHGLNPYGKLTIFSGEKLPALHVGESQITQPLLLDTWVEALSKPYSGIIVHPEIKLSDSQMRQLMQLRLKGSIICQLPDFYEIWWQRVPPSTLHDTWFAFGAGFDLVTGRFGLKVKRLIDVCAALSMLLLFSPIMIVAAIAVKLDSPGPIFYSQVRNGSHRNSFWVRKFRSMYQDAEQRGGVQWAKKNDPRITPVGNFLRLTRIDELPQIWNVLTGEMSLIGPRPERPQFDEQLAEEIPYYNLRYLVKPGITGWAQVMYPYGASVEDAYEKLSYDLYYIKNYSIWLDLAILFKTVRVVLLGKGR
jgi:exopolysaccharide biosynthesis polyprenyl glycosylphosphotransferase